MHWLPMIAARSHYSTASLIATLKNALGGKPDEADDSPPVKPEKLFRPEEELPYFAWMGDAPSVGLSRAAAKAILRVSSQLPLWALQDGLLDRAKRTA